MADELYLCVGGRLYAGWTEITVNRSLETAAADFGVTFNDRWTGQSQPWPIEVGDACEVLIGEDLVMRGWVDDAEPAYDKDGRVFTVRGRDRAGDLVDCSAIHKPGSWSGRKLEQIAVELVRPFGLSVSVTVDTGAPFRRFALEQGETVWEALERMGRLRGVLVTSDAAGDVRIWRPTATPSGAVLKQGVNILSARLQHSARERFSRYLLKGQAAGDDHLNGVVIAQAKAEATDPAVQRYRPMLIVAEDQGSGGTLKQRAAWEATVRAGRAQQPVITVQGWRDPAGRLWEPDRLDRIVSPWLSLDQDMLLTGVAYRKGDQGTTTELHYMRPEAFTVEPISAAARASTLNEGRRSAA